jgi:transcriptional regulator with XRE-family HTH domain
MSMKQHTVSELIEQITAHTGLTQGDIADRIGYSRPHLNRVIHGNIDKPDRLLGRLRKEFSEIVDSMYSQPSLSQNAKVVRPAREDDNRIADLEKRVQEIERKLAEMQGQLTLIASLLRR